MESKLYRTSLCYRPLSVLVSDKEYELGDIIIYNNEGVIVEVGNGYFDCDKELTIKGEIVKKIKVSFDKKVNFIKKMEERYWGADIRYCLYIYVDNVDFKDLGKVKQYDSIYNKYSINGLEVRVFQYALDTKKSELNRQAKAKIEELEKMFSYGNNGNDESKLLEIFSSLQDLNRQIVAEYQYIQDFKVE